VIGLKPGVNFSFPIISTLAVVLSVIVSIDNSENSLEKAISFEKELLQYHSDLIKLSDK
jgi:hypothetical protein